MPVLMQSVLDQDVKFNKRCKPFNKFSAFLTLRHTVKSISAMICSTV